ncbi:hypothetical protein BpHYR1_026289 [Brachionus plicatilis]|uniref:Uncharacterized protein n=1 Tax=Brachionus plicatilis TaxID=10195 RepID=A0A3M7Q932_BRAPC|nr:hypothetical protein BpHYR1_026289 [Brachionus plicatilis]
MLNSMQFKKKSFSYYKQSKLANLRISCSELFGTKKVRITINTTLCQNKFMLLLAFACTNKE